MIVDSHVHPVAADHGRYPLSPLGGQQSTWSEGIHMTGEDLMQYMAGAGVDQAVLAQAASVHGYDNSFGCDVARQYPDRFAMVGSIDPLAPGAPDTLAYWVKERGMHGLRLVVQGSTTTEAQWLDDPVTYPVWERAEELGIPIVLQMRATALPMAHRVIARYPGVRVAIDHLARPRLDDGPPYTAAASMIDLAKYPNVHLKFTPYLFREGAEGKSTVRAVFELLLDRFGPQRLLWGSNFPNHRGSDSAPYKDLVDEARDGLAFLSAADREQVFAGTARALFPSLDGR